MKKKQFHDTAILIQKAFKRILLFCYSRIEYIIGRYKFRLIPVGDAKQTTLWNVFESTGKDPQILLVPKGRHYPTGSIELSLWMKIPSGDTAYFTLLYDLGKGFNTQDSLEIAFLNDKISLIRLDLPDQIKALRLDLCADVGEIIFRNFEIRKISKFELIRDIIRSRNIHTFKDMMTIVKNGHRILKSQGLSGLFERFKVKSEGNYGDWISLYDTLDDQSVELIKKSIVEFQYMPLISIVMPVYNTPEITLRESLDSVLAQIYTNWELCIVDDYSNEPHVNLILEKYCNKSPKIHVRYRAVNGHISRASNDALKMAHGEFIALMDHDDLIASDALFHIVQALNKNPELDLLYSDEDKVNGSGKRYDPYFKPDWNPHLFLGQNYLNHLTAARKSLVVDVGGFREGLEGSQDWDLYMRLIEKIDPKRIFHIPHVLYHWRASKGSTALRTEEKSYILDAQKRVLMDHFERIGKNVVLQKLESGYWYPSFPCPATLPLVSIIVPTKDKVDLLERCIQSIQTKTSYPNYEILVVDNLSEADRSIKYLQNLRKNNNVRVIEYTKPFNFSAINNFAVPQTNGTIMVLLNNDTEVITSNWLEQLVSYASLPDIGAVGTMLYYPDDTIQHAGVILGIGGVAGHAYLGEPRGSNGQFGRLKLVQNLSAVTAACLAIEKRKFIEVGGFEQKELKIAFNDVDFCVKLLQKGYRNLWTPNVELYHYESASRGYEDTPEKKKRFESEVLYMLKKWKVVLNFDPAYNPNLSLQHSNFRIPCKPRVNKFGDNPMET